MNRNEPKNVSNFGAESEAAAAIARVKSGRVPLGGTAMPSMPRLDQPPPDRHQGVQTVAAARKVLTKEEQIKLQEQGKFVPGVGSAYAANQPMMPQNPTNEHGEEVPINPRLAPRPAGAGLRPETVKQLEAVAAVNSSKDDIALQKIKEEIDQVDEVFETNEFGEQVRSLLGNKKRKEIIESRCQPMNFEELILNNSVQQKVPIIPGKFEPSFRSLQGDEDLEIKRLMGKVRGPDQYVLDLFSVYQLTAGLFSINGKALPDHLDNNGDFNEDLFMAKYKRVVKMAIPVLADLSVNFQWFARRVQKLTVIDEIKGF